MSNPFRIALKVWLCLLLVASWILLAPGAKLTWSISYAVAVVWFIIGIIFWEKLTR
jgi:hypothetical protein